MRKVFYIALLAAFALAAVPALGQHYLGVRAGYGSGSIRLYPPVETGSVWGCKNFGVSWKYYSKEKYLGGVEVDLHYIQKGYSEPEPGKPDTVFVHRVNTAELPIFWQPHLYVLGRKMRVFLNAGVVFSYNIDASEETFSKTRGVIEPLQPYDMILVRDNRWGFGLCGGFGINYIIGRFEATAEARYNFGYSDLYKNRNVYYPNFYLRSPIDNLYFTVGAYYRLGKGGILAPPSKKLAAKMAAREAERALQPPKPSKKSKEPTPDTTGTPAAEPAQTADPAAPAAPIPTPENTPQHGNDTPAQSSPTDTEGHQ